MSIYPIASSIGLGSNSVSDLKARKHEHSESFNLDLVDSKIENKIDKNDNIKNKHSNPPIPKEPSTEMFLKYNK